MEKQADYTKENIFEKIKSGDGICVAVTHQGGQATCWIKAIEERPTALKVEIGEGTLPASLQSAWIPKSVIKRGFSHRWPDGWEEWNLPKWFELT